MSRSMWVWRWRSNPLRRRSYVVEAWALLVVGLVTAVGASLAGVAMTGDVQHHLAQQRVERHLTPAVLTENPSDVPEYVSESRVQVRWVAPDGSRRTGRAKVDAGLKRGAEVKVWTDARGELVRAPLTASVARLDALTVGAAAAVGVCGAVFVVWALAVQVADRRRAEKWAAEWAEVGPQWDRRKA